ncbi:hypothetical protein, partial [Dendronalium sp. ChiSLP03b]|uniref:hypothetical protein n=1 Tax=Dendronalium sp. ChiSLP03b TaxID=3075381 RepID=UPI00391A42E3
STVEKVPEINSVSTLSTNAAIASTTPSVNHPESTVIQSQIESRDSVSTVEKVPEINKVPISSQNTAIAPITPSANAHPESTIIQPQFDSTDSFLNIETSLEINNITASFQNVAIASTNTPTTADTELTVIQPQIESKNSVSDIEGLPKINNVLTSSQNVAIASTTTSANHPESTVIQPKLKSENSVSTAEKVPEINNVPTSSQDVALTPTATSATYPESIIIQPQIESIDSSSIVETLPEINSVKNSSQNIAFISKSMPVILEAETPFIQSKKEIQHPNHSSEIPQLPTVLKKISIFSPLSQTSNFLTSTFADETASPDTSTPVSFPSLSNHIQKSPMKDIPNSWSSIAELLGESTAVENSPTIVIQPLPNEKREFTYIASPQSYHSQSQPKTHYPKSSSSNKVIQAYTEPSSSISVQTIEETDNEVTITNELPEDEYENLELLAREIYKMLQQRLEIEQERRGKNYSGRLPW